jgi:hypothetical protein
MERPGPVKMSVHRCVRNSESPCGAAFTRYCFAWIIISAPSAPSHRLTWRQIIVKYQLPSAA